MLKAQRVGIVRHKLVVFDIIAEVHSGHFRSGQGGTVAAILELVVVDVGDVAHLLVVDVGGVVGVIHRDKGGGILDINEVVLVRAVVDGDVIAAVVLVVIEIVLGVIVLGELVVIVVVGGVVVVPGLEVCAVGVIIVVRGVLVQEVLQLDIGFVVVCGRVVGGVVDGIEGLVVAVDDLGIIGISASVVVGDVAVFVLHAAGWRGIVGLWLRRYVFRRKQGIQRMVLQ